MLSLLLMLFFAQIIAHNVVWQLIFNVCIALLHKTLTIQITLGIHSLNMKQL